MVETQNVEGGPWSVIDRLRCFNAKERYWVVRQALGRFQPSVAFLRAAARAAGVDPPQPAAVRSAFLAMDYHLNWLYAALAGGTPDGAARYNARLAPFRAAAPGGDAPAGPPRFLIENSQEDIDLLLAYVRPDGGTQLILVEAKCTSGFTDAQLASKVARLCGILQHAAPDVSQVDIKLVLQSPPGLQREETIRERLAAVRGECARFGLEHLIPETHRGCGWLPLAVAPHDPDGFWVVKFGTGELSEAEHGERLAAAKDKQRFYWPTWRLERRRRLAGDVPSPGTAGEPDRMP